MLDVLIAGAGPAGSTAALLLARARKAVRIYERAAFPRTKPCGEYLSPGSVRLLYQLGVGPQLAAYARPVDGVRLHGHGVHAAIDFAQPGWSLPRALLDDTLLQAALEAGAAIVRGRAEDCSDGAQSASLTIRLPDGTLSTVDARALVGADGMHSLVARKCGLATAQRRPARFALGGHYAGLRSLDGYIDMYVHGSTYVAINPLTDTTANVMLVVNERELEDSRGDVDAFVKARIREVAGGVLDGARLEEKRVAIGPLAYRARKIAGRSALLAGDAACFVDPFTGQGVYLALRCAQLAAECIETGNLRDYARRAGAEIARRERAARGVSSLIRSPLLSRSAAALLRRQPAMLRPLVQRVTGAA
jgi:flavin-dependent dehydrogenase